MRNRITDIFGIKYPIISGGMVWCSGWKLAAAVSNAGGLGLIGAGSMYRMCLGSISASVSLLQTNRTG